MQKFEIKFGGYQGPDSIHTAATRLFGSVLLDQQDIPIKFNLEESILDRGLKAGDLPKMVASGTMDICYTSSVRCAKAVPEISIFELPFLIDDRSSLFKALDGELGTYFCDRIEQQTPYKLLGFWDNGFRHISNSVRPIRRPQDCRGLAIRTQMSILHGEVFRAFGFKPTAIDIKDFLETIDTDRFQAQDNPLTSIHIFNIHKHHRHITLSGHFFGVSLLLCHRGKFEDWPEEVQKLITKTTKQATTCQRQLASEQDEIVLAKLDTEDNEIICLSPDERNAFKKVVAPLMDHYQEKFDSKLFKLLKN